MCQPFRLFCLFSFFSNTNLSEKTETSAGFKLGSLEEKASMLTTWPPPRPNNFVTLKIREIEIKFDRLENYQNVYQPFMKRDNIKEMDQFWC